VLASHLKHLLQQKFILLSAAIMVKARNTNSLEANNYEKTSPLRSNAMPRHRLLQAQTMEPRLIALSFC